MPLDLQDTIVALSSAPGPGARGIVRLTGPNALRLVLSWFDGSNPAGQRQVVPGQILLKGMAAGLPADLYYFPGPRTFTGQELVEIHTISSPPLLDLLIEQFLQSGARAAQPGEFTLRAFLAGKLDLPRAEAILGVVSATNRAELRQALTQLAGGLTQPLAGMREDLLNLLADIEAGLDFSEEDLHFVDQRTLLLRLTKAMAQVTLTRRQLESRSLSRQPFRVVFVGPPNVGKSSLFNALLGQPAALTSAIPGTTRDYLVHTLPLEDITLELVDTAGWQQAADQIEQQAQTLGAEQQQTGDLLLICVEAGATLPEEQRALLARRDPERSITLATKCDRGESIPGCLATSARTGLGLDVLRARLRDAARRHQRDALAPSLSRCRHHVDRCLDHLRRAHHAALFSEPPELLAIELRGALDQVGEMIGAVYTDDLLDRIFSRFCIGK